MSLDEENGQQNFSGTFKILHILSSFPNHAIRHLILSMQGWRPDSLPAGAPRSPGEEWLVLHYASDVRQTGWPRPLLKVQVALSGNMKETWGEVSGLRVYKASCHVWVYQECSKHQSQHQMLKRCPFPHVKSNVLYILKKVQLQIRIKVLNRK